MATKTLHINVDEKIIDLFDKCYPHSRKRFVENCLDKASQDKKFFLSIFFKDMLTDDFINSN